MNPCHSVFVLEATCRRGWVPELHAGVVVEQWALYFSQLRIVVCVCLCFLFKLVSTEGDDSLVPGQR